LVVQSLNAELQPQGLPLVANDAIGAGVGELVFWCRGKEASFPFRREDTPNDCTIVGIVDSDAHVSGRRVAR
jgi:microcompartment protein CcmK/EutM